MGASKHRYIIFPIKKINLYIYIRIVFLLKKSIFMYDAKIMEQLIIINLVGDKGYA